jgi:ribosomal protein uL22
MALYEYSLKPAAIVGKAQAYDLDCSYKDLTQVMRAIRDQPLSKAYRILEQAIQKTHAIPYVKFAKGCGHRSELGGKKGRYPKKECRFALKLLHNAAANALAQGLAEESLYVRHAAAYKQSVFRRYRQFWVSGTVLGYGKNATWANYETAHMEIIVSGKVDEKSEFNAKTKEKNKPAKTASKPPEKKDSKIEPTPKPTPTSKTESKDAAPKKVENIAVVKTEKTTEKKDNSAKAPQVVINNPAPSPVQHEKK